MPGVWRREALRWRDGRPASADKYAAWPDVIVNVAKGFDDLLQPVWWPHASGSFDRTNHARLRWLIFVQLISPVGDLLPHKVCCRIIQSSRETGGCLAYDDLRAWIAALERAGELKVIRTEVDPILEIAEITDRVSKRPVWGRVSDPAGPGIARQPSPGGPALLFQNVKGHPGAQVLSTSSAPPAA